MKKIYKVTNWDDSALSAANIADKSHWFIKSINECFQMMGLTATFTYLNGTRAKFSIAGYSNELSFSWYYSGLNDSFKVQSTSFIWYVNTEKMELVGCACFNGTTTSYLESNYTRSGIYYATNGRLCRVGPLIALKFQDNKIKGMIKAVSDYTGNGSSNNMLGFLSSQIGVPLADCKTFKTPTVAVKYRGRRCRMPILEGEYHTTKNSYVTQPPQFNGEYFEDVYVTEDYYTVPMIDKRRNLYVYDGKAFLVDDLTDIGTITT